MILEPEHRLFSGRWVDLIPHRQAGNGTPVAEGQAGHPRVAAVLAPGLGTGIPYCKRDI
jgi:hypothetical protein